MLTQFIRVFKGQDGSPISLSDISMEIAEKSSQVFNQKYLYIAQKFPFNNIFFLLGAVLNTQTSKMKIEYWTSVGWKSAVDVLDFTNGFKKNALVQFQLDNEFSWERISESDSNETTNIPEEVKGKHINDCWWIRISFDIAPDVTTEVKSVGYAFTTTEVVNGVDTQAPRYYNTFQTGKTNWLDEILMGSQMMIADMKSSGLLKSHGQIIELDDYYLPCAYRVLEHIYSQMGTAYDGKRGEVKALYKKFIAGPKTLDQNVDAKIKQNERVSSAPRMYR